MLALNVTVPVACFRKPLAREYFETGAIPPPSTCYGFLLSLVGEADRRRHVGARVCPSLLTSEGPSVVLRTMWRVKSLPLGSSGNERPDYQQLLTNVRLVLWLDSRDEQGEAPTLESRVRDALARPSSVERFGGLSLGESTHLVDEVSIQESPPQATARTFLLQEDGRATLPVWADHVGAAQTRYVTGDLVAGPVLPPPVERMPRIAPT